MSRSLSAQETSSPGAPYSIGNRVRRLAWNVCYISLFRYSPRTFHTWRSVILKLFGASLGKGCHIYPSARIWAPWNLECGDVVGIAEDSIIYNPSRISIGSFAVISQQAYLCGATHDIDVPEFTLHSKPIVIGERAWVCARAIVQPGVTLGEGSVLGAGSVATKDLEPWGVYGGVPARLLRQRKHS